MTCLNRLDSIGTKVTENFSRDISLTLDNENLSQENMVSGINDKVENEEADFASDNTGESVN